MNIVMTLPGFMAVSLALAKESGYLFRKVTYLFQNRKAIGRKTFPLMLKKYENKCHLMSHIPSGFPPVMAAKGQEAKYGAGN